MSKLPKYTLKYNQRKGDWGLYQDGSNRSKKRFETKANATSGGTLKRAVGQDGGSVKIQKTNGQYQEERTYPRDKDPSRSKG